LLPPNRGVGGHGEVHLGGWGGGVKPPRGGAGGIFSDPICKGVGKGSFGGGAGTPTGGVHGGGGGGKGGWGGGGGRRFFNANGKGAVSKKGEKKGLEGVGGGAQGLEQLPGGGRPFSSGCFLWITSKKPGHGGGGRFKRGKTTRGGNIWGGEGGGGEGHLGAGGRGGGGVGEVKVVGKKKRGQGKGGCGGNVSKPRGGKPFFLGGEGSQGRGLGFGCNWGEKTPTPGA